MADQLGVKFPLIPLLKREVAVQLGETNRFKILFPLIPLLKREVAHKMSATTDCPDGSFH